METLRVTLVTTLDPFLSVTGGEINHRTLARELAKIGHDVRLVYPCPTRSQRTSWGSVRCVAIPVDAIPVAGNLQANVRVLRYLRTTNRSQTGEIIDFRGCGLGPAFSRLRSEPSGRVFHTVDFVPAEFRSLSTGAALLSAHRYLPLALYERLCVRSAKCVVVDTAAVRAAFEQRYQRARAAFVAIPPMVPWDWGPRDQTGYDPLHLLFVGAGPRRDTELFIKLLAELRRRGYSAHGTILREPRERFRRLASSESTLVRFLDPISESALRSLYSDACAFILPSRREAFCGSIVEAAYNFTPSVVSDLAPLREFVAHGSTGLVVKSLEVSGWATAVLELIQNPDIRMTLARNAHALATAKYTARQMVQATLHCYELAMA